LRHIEAAINNIGKKPPRIKTTVKLAPVDIRKEGSAFDLHIAAALIGQQTK
jgi:predicted ATPase with chaperone activity